MKVNTIPMFGILVVICAVHLTRINSTDLNATIADVLHLEFTLDLRGIPNFKTLSMNSAATLTRIRSPCKHPASVVKASLADISGTMQYVKYYTGEEGYGLDGLAYVIENGGGRNYTVNMITITKENKRFLRTFASIDHPSSNADEQYYMSNKGRQIFYSIPYLEKYSSAVLYRCIPNDVGEYRPVTLVLTNCHCNDVTKAVEVAKNISSQDEKLVEFPFTYKLLFFT